MNGAPIRGDWATSATEAGVAMDMIGSAGDESAATIGAASGVSGPAALGRLNAPGGDGTRTGGDAAATCATCPAAKMPGVDTEGVGREKRGGALSIAPVNAGVPRGKPLDGVVAATGVCNDVGVRDATVGFVSGVVAPSVIRRMAPQTLHRALTPFGGTLAGSTLKIDRQS